MKIGVVGGGVVGNATARSYLEHVDEVRVFDVLPERRTHPLDSVLQCDFVFVCLPTPAFPDGGGLDTSSVTNFFGMIAPYSKETNLVLKSTVPVGTTRALRDRLGLRNLVHSPEFLTARCALLDASLPSRNIVGYTGDSDDPCAPGLLDLYIRRFPNAVPMLMTSDESEAVKLFQNSFFAVKVAFWNEMYQIAEAFGLGWGRVMDGILADGRIHPSHTAVPGPDGAFGFGGSCLPKDLSEMALQFDAEVCRAALSRNKRDRD